MPRRNEDHVVVDVEIEKTIEELPGGWNATDKMGVACACVWEYSGQRMRVYGPKDVEDLQTRLLKADRISGYNIWNFDFPVIWGISKNDWKNDSAFAMPVKERLMAKTNDLLRRIWLSLDLNPDRFVPRTHGGWKLDDVAEATLGVGKIGHGANAPKWYQEGLIQKVVNYCSDDVAIERDLSDFIDRHGYVVRRKRRGDVGETLLITSQP